MYHLQKAARVKSQSSSGACPLHAGSGVISLCGSKQQWAVRQHCCFFLVPHQANTDSITIHLNK